MLPILIYQNLRLNQRALVSFSACVDSSKIDFTLHYRCITQSLHPTAPTFNPVTQALFTPHPKAYIMTQPPARKSAESQIPTARPPTASPTPSLPQVSVAPNPPQLNSAGPTPPSFPSSPPPHTPCCIPILGLIALTSLIPPGLPGTSPISGCR